jgi:hypothetical protein
MSPEQAQREKIRKAVALMKAYIDTYDNQPYYKDFTEGTFIEDMLYGIGMALNPKEYEWADGFQKFKQRLLIEHMPSSIK